MSKEYKRYRAIVALGIFLTNFAAPYILAIGILARDVVGVMLAPLIFVFALYFDYNLLEHGLDAFLPPEILKEKAQVI